MKHYYIFLLLALFPSIQTKAQNTDLCGQAEVTNSWFQKHPELKIKYDKQQQAVACLG